MIILFEVHYFKLLLIKFYFEVNGKQPEALQSSTDQTEVLEITETVKEPELTNIIDVVQTETPVELVTSPELVTSTSVGEIEEKLEEIVGKIKENEPKLIQKSFLCKNFLII